MGGGGSVREAGGKFAEMEVAREEQYFRKLVSVRFAFSRDFYSSLQQAAQLKNLKQELDHEISHHEHEMARHAAAIERHKKRVQEIEKEQNDAQK